MGKIKNINTILGTVYLKVDNDETILQQAGAVGITNEFKGKKYFIITDLLGRKIPDANYYLNGYLSNAGYKVREQAFSALKIFYSYIELFMLEQSLKQGLTKQQVNGLLEFLKGGNRSGTAWDLEIDTVRSNKTISTYLNVYRDFYSSIFNISDSALHAKKNIGVIRGTGLLGHANKKALEIYESNPKTKKLMLTPKYIKQEEYKLIVDLIEQEYSIREDVIIKLMYEYSLRIGEVLGITFEDIEETSDDDVYKIILRNRVSDKPFQCAKSVLNPSDTNEYSTREYSQEKIGYQVVYIHEEMKELIEEYIDEVWDEQVLSKSPKKKSNLLNASKADTVTFKENPYNKENYYIFISKQHYKPLTQTGWNKVLRSIFEKVGIKLDDKVRKDNLSHRFRHGFAMNKVKEGLNEMELAAALRHSGTHSVQKYYNPDEEDYIQLLKKTRVK